MGIALLGAWNQDIDLFFNLFFMVSQEEQDLVVKRIHKTLHV